LAAWLPPGLAGAIVGAVLLYLALGARSLEEHAEAVAQSLEAGEVGRAREAVGRIVSRDVAALDEPGVAKATVESVLENGNDAIFGAIFWFALAGPAGVVLYRLANTLDAMWGYRNERYRAFGWAAARLDDVLNYLPARLTALSYALCGATRPALRAWRMQGAHWKSPNAGPVMAAGAGSMEVVLGGAAVYGGTAQQRPALGVGRAVEAGDIRRALALLRRAMGLWAVVAIIAGVWRYGA